MYQIELLHILVNVQLVLHMKLMLHLVLHRHHNHLDHHLTMNLHYHWMMQNHHDNDDDGDDVYFPYHHRWVKLEKYKYIIYNRKVNLYYCSIEPFVTPFVLISSSSFDALPPLSPALNSFTRSA
jgi:hypothetical protein